MKSGARETAPAPLRSPEAVRREWRLPVPAVVKSPRGPLWTGKQLLSEMLPADLFMRLKLGRRDDTLAAIAELRRAHPHSRRLDDAKVLEAEARQSSGQPVRPEPQVQVQVQPARRQPESAQERQQGLVPLEQP